MNWLIILLVSLFGVLLGIISIFGLVDLNPWILSIATWLLSALVLGRYAKTKYFQHGFITGIISSLVSSLLIYFFFDSYVANNPEIAARMSQIPEGFDMKTMMLISSLIGAVIGGVVLGLLTMLSGKLFGEPAAKTIPPAPTPPAEEKNDSPQP